jgi:poly(3-hydroxybutyrate) depolymerase
METPIMKQFQFPRRDVLAAIGAGMSGALLSACASTTGQSDAKSMPSPAAIIPPKLKAGTHRLEMPEATGATATPMGIFIHQPEKWTTRDSIMIVMHGTNRDADRYLANWIEHASASGMLLITPEFNATKFPGRSFYNFGNVVDDKIVANGHLTFLTACLRMCAKLLARRGTATDCMAIPQARSLSIASCF